MSGGSAAVLGSLLFGTHVIALLLGALLGRAWADPQHRARRVARRCERRHRRRQLDLPWPPR